MKNLIEPEDFNEADELIKDRINRINEIHQRIRLKRQKRLDSITFRGPSNRALKLKILKEASLRRILDISESAAQAWESKRHVVSFILLRGMLENSSVLLFVVNQLLSLCKKLDENGFDKLIDPIIFGSSHPKAFMKVTRIGNIIKYADQKLNGVKSEYDFLSDITHPNATGMMSFYGQLKNENGLFYEEIDTGNERNKRNYILSMHYSLAIFDMAFHQAEDFVPFIAEIRNQIRQNEEVKN